MNAFFSRILSQAQDLWRHLTGAQKIWALGIGLVTLSLLISIIFFVQKTVWVELGSFDLQQAASIKAELEKSGYKAGVDYQFQDNGRIDVAATKRNEIMLALAKNGLYGHQEKGFSIFEEFDITTTDYEQRLRTLEALKSEMRRILRSYSQIEDVNITVPYIEQESLFTDKQIEQTASVVLILKPGSQLDASQIKAIRGIIAGGFSGLKQENISLTDQYARQLVPDDDEMTASGVSTKQSEIVRQTKRALEADICKVLGPVLGSDKFTVSVNVEFDWDYYKENSDKFSVPGFEQYKNSEQIKEETLNGTALRPGGEPGVAANTAPVYQAVGNTGPVNYTNSEKIVNYLADKTVVERIRSPYVKRLTASVAVDGIWKKTTDTEGKTIRLYEPRTKEDMEQIRALVQSALGNNPQREDLIEVRNLAWSHEGEWDAIDAKQQAKEYQRKLMLFSLAALPLIVVFLLMYAAWRRHVKVKSEELLRQRELERQRALAAAEAGISGEISLEEQERQDIHRRASTLARAKPQVVADLLRTWMAEESAS